MSEEQSVQGKFVRGRTLVHDAQMRHSLELRGYGEVDKDEFVLADFESLYLVYQKTLVLKRANTTMTFDTLFEAYQKADPSILTKFLIYRDLRTRGYVPKAGFGFGCDFRVYERGQYGEKSAKYLVFALNEGQYEKIGPLQNKISQITQMGKEPIIAVLERRGEVIYYKISGINFLENKFRT